MNIGFMGLGKLGLPCALAVEMRGHKVVGYDPSPNVKKILDTKKLPYKEIWAQDYLDKTNIKIKIIFSKAFALIIDAVEKIDNKNRNK